MNSASRPPGDGPGRGLRTRTLSALASLLLVAGIPASGAEDRVVTSEGMAPVKADDAVAARNAAIENALRLAVEQVVRDLIDREIARQNYERLNDSIYSRAQGFVQKYDLLDWNREGSLFHVTISATVAVGDIRNDLETLGLLIQAMRKPRVMVMVPETNVLDHEWWRQWTTHVGTAETEIIRALTSREFTVMDAPTVRESIDRDAALRAIEGDAEAAQRIAQQIGAEVLITGQAVSEPAGAVMGSQMSSYQATVSARAVKADTGEILGVSTGSGKAVHLNATAGGREALSQAGTSVAGDLIHQIASRWAKEVSGSRLIGLSITGMTKELLDDLVALLRSRVRGVVDVYRREFAGDVGRLDVRFLGDSEALSQALLAFQPQGGHIFVTAATPNKLDIRYEAADPGEDTEDPS